MKLIENWSYYRRSLFENDWKSGLSVFLVALPLCLGIALASGAPLFSGLVAGIVAGVLVSLLSGSEISVSGPAAGLTVIVAAAITKLESFEGFLVAVILAGLLQLLLGLLKAGRLSAYFPESVIRGMLVAIGIVIILKQIPHALGDDQDAEGEFEFLQNDHENTITELIKSVVSFHEGALIISVLAIALLVFWDKLAKKGIGFFKAFPSSLAAVLVGVGLNEWFRVSFPAFFLGNLPTHMVNVPIASGDKGILSIFTFPDFSFISNPQVWVTAGTIAIVASLETLLNLEASDAIDPYKRISSPNKELVAQGIGNFVSGMIGGLPITSVVVRTSANVYSGARSRMSAFVHGLLLCVAVFALPGLLNRIPLSSLAAVLIMVGWKLAKPSHFIKQWKEGMDQFIPFVVTILLVVFTDLLMGIFIGTFVGLAFVLYTNFHSVLTVIRDENRVLIKFNKDVSFLNKPKIKQVLSEIEAGDLVIFDGSRAQFIDYDVFQLMKEFKENATEREVQVEFKSVSRRKLEDRKATEVL